MVLSSGFRILGFGVNLGNKDIGFVDEIGSNLLPDWGEGLAVWQEMSINSS